MTHYLTRVQTYWCDKAGCNESFEAEGDARSVWASARRAGWRMSGSGRHFCSVHA